MKSACRPGTKSWRASTCSSVISAALRLCWGVSGCLLAPCTAGAALVLGSTELFLSRDNVRSQPTALGNLVADSLLWQAQAGGAGATISIINGGSIRASLPYAAATSYPADITDLDVFAVLPFGINVTVVRSVDIATLLQALEHSVSSLPYAGRYLQTGGFSYSFDANAAVGSRIIDVTLGSTTALLRNGVIVSSLMLDIAMTDFLSGGDDGFSMFTGFQVDDTGVLDRDALGNFIRDGLGGLVSEQDYPASGERLIRSLYSVPEPGSAALAATALLALAGMLLCRRRKGEVHVSDQPSITALRIFTRCCCMSPNPQQKAWLRRRQAVEPATGP